MFLHWHHHGCPRTAMHLGNGLVSLYMAMSLPESMVFMDALRSLSCLRKVSTYLTSGRSRSLSTWIIKIRMTVHSKRLLLNSFETGHPLHRALLRSWERTRILEFFTLSMPQRFSFSPRRPATGTGMCSRSPPHYDMTVVLVNLGNGSLVSSQVLVAVR
jgi:hypothetical protein